MNSQIFVLWYVAPVDWSLDFTLYRIELNPALQINDESSEVKVSHKFCIDLENYSLLQYSAKKFVLFKL